MVGIASGAEGGVLFTDVNNNRVRHVRPDGTIETVAGSGLLPGIDNSFVGDRGPATAARLFAPQEVLPLRGGGFLVSDTRNARVRQVAPNGIITTFAGDGDIYTGFGGDGDGGPARRASIDHPTGLARLPGGAIAIGDGPRIRRVARTGRIGTLVNLAALTGGGACLGDFAGRTGGDVQGLAVTAERGLAIAGHGGLYYRAPRDTKRTLVTLRDARVSRQHVAVELDASQPGRARLEVRRRERLIARTTHRIKAGRSKLGVNGRFPARTHTVRVRLTGTTGAVARDQVSLFTSRVLPALNSNAELTSRVDQLADSAGAQDEGYIDRCRRQTPRRIDCAVAYAGRYCVSVIAVLLRPSGGMFWRLYDCAGSLARPFRRAPGVLWQGPAERLPDAPA
jgi:hypothetical protein